MSRTDEPLASRAAVVTGAATGIGAAIARRLAADGADVLIHHRGAGDNATEVADQCGRPGVRVGTCEADFAQEPADAAVVVDHAVELFGHVDVLVNNAAVTTGAESVIDHSPKLLQETLAVNVLAVFYATQAAARHMASRGIQGRIINIGSIHQRATNPDAVAYATSKGAVAALTIASAVSLGQYGITVNCVAPGAIYVDRYRLNANYDQTWYEQRTPLGRVGHPDDVAGVVAFLAGADAGFITGETVFIDGGASRRNSFLRG